MLLLLLLLPQRQLHVLQIIVRPAVPAQHVTARRCEAGRRLLPLVPLVLPALFPRATGRGGDLVQRLPQLAQLRIRALRPSCTFPAAPRAAAAVAHERKRKDGGHTEVTGSSGGGGGGRGGAAGGGWRYVVV